MRATDRTVWPFGLHRAAARLCRSLDYFMSAEGQGVAAGKRLTTNRYVVVDQYTIGAFASLY